MSVEKVYDLTVELVLIIRVCGGSGLFCREPGLSVTATQQCIISKCTVSDSPVLPIQGHLTCFM